MKQKHHLIVLSQTHKGITYKYLPHMFFQLVSHFYLSQPNFEAINKEKLYL